MKRRVSQAGLEMVVLFTSAIVFFIGITRMWVWSNGQVVGRTVAYHASRLEAGTTHPGFWGASDEGVYTPKEITEEWVFSGNSAAEQLFCG